jgi:hypothetical protein
MESNETPVYKFTLSSGKEIYLREPKMSDSESCIQIAGLKAKDNMALLGLLTQKELFKKLLVQVDGKVLKMAEKENLDSIFSFKEWNQCSQALAMVTGENEGNLASPEITTIGSK